MVLIVIAVANNGSIGPIQQLAHSEAQTGDKYLTAPSGEHSTSSLLLTCAK